MSEVTPILPRILILDDLFGRNVSGGRNSDRENLCAHFLWQDVTGDAATKASRQEILKPTATAIFGRAQTPGLADLGAVVENDLQGALGLVRTGWTEAFEKGQPPWTMVLLDLCFYTGRVTEESNRRTPGMPAGRFGDDDLYRYFGLNLLEAIHREFPELPVFILSSKPREAVSLEFSKLGALGFIDRSDLRGPDLLQEAFWHHGLLPDSWGEIVGNSLPLLLALRKARQAAKQRDNILIRGERGTGKELMASYLHRTEESLQQKKRPLVAVNAPVLSSTMFASELFGIMPNTATGVAGKTGLIELADKGDLFLDEIGDMLPEVQAALLRVLQERQITPVGARKPKTVDVRFLSATNANIEDGSKLRPEILDRLRLGGTIWLPPLRKRKTDIRLLVKKIVLEAEEKQGAMHRAITPEVFDLLSEYEWPGNVRELRACIFDAISRYPDVEHLVPGHLRINEFEQQKFIDGVSAIQQNEPLPQKQFADFDNSIDGLLELLQRFEFAHLGKPTLVGNLGDLEHAFSLFLARYLRAAINETKKGNTIDNPEGDIYYHPAFKLIAGDPAIKPDAAKKHIRQMLEPLKDELDGDLLDLYEKIRDPKNKSVRKHRINKLPRKRSTGKIQ